MTIPAKLVKELRDQTGAGMMDSKRALEETKGDLEAARRGSKRARERCSPSTCTRLRTSAACS